MSEKYALVGTSSTRGPPCRRSFKRELHRVARTAPVPTPWMAYGARGSTDAPVPTGVRSPRAVVHQGDSHMRKHRSTIGALGALSIVLLAPFVGTAQAAAPADRGAGERILTAPAAPEGAETATARGAAAVAPTLSPGADYQHVAPGGTFGCKAGNLCASVWDPTKSKWKIYFLYTCNRYYLSNWEGTGQYWNRQTGTPTSTFYGQSGNTIKSFKPFSGKRDQSWSPVWSIRNC